MACRAPMRFSYLLSIDVFSDVWVERSERRTSSIFFESHAITKFAVALRPLHKLKLWIIIDIPSRLQTQFELPPRT